MLNNKYVKGMFYGVLAFGMGASASGIVVNEVGRKKYEPTIESIAGRYNVNNNNEGGRLEVGELYNLLMDLGVNVKKIKEYTSLYEGNMPVSDVVLMHNNDGWSGISNRSMMDNAGGTITLFLGKDLIERLTDERLM